MRKGKQFADRLGIKCFHLKMPERCVIMQQIDLSYMTMLFLTGSDHSFTFVGLLLSIFDIKIIFTVYILYIVINFSHPPCDCLFRLEK